MAVTPITSKKRKTSKKTDVLAPVPVKTLARAPRSKSTPDTAENTVSSEKPDMAKKLVTSKKRKSGNAVSRLQTNQAMRRDLRGVVSAFINNMYRTRRLQHQRRPRSARSLLQRLVVFPFILDFDADMKLGASHNS